jgi:hypothetical protein
VIDLLQWLGGAFYLLNKIFLSLSEHAYNHDDRIRARQWRIVSWLVYLIGLSPWVILFILKHNWIAASVEASGAPAMLLGLVLAWRGSTNKPPSFLNYLAIICIPLGFIYSLYDFGGLNTLNQWLEIGLVLGFLVGTYQLAKERASGYLWYILMHLCCAYLMWVQDYPWLSVQQVVSLVFIVDAYQVTQKRKNIIKTDYN